MFSPPPQSTPPPPERSVALMIALVFGGIVAGMLVVYLVLPRAPEPIPNTATQPVSRDALQVVEGQLVYVPAYSEIFYGSASATRALTVTLAIHNTDPTHSIILNSVRYFDTEGNLVQNYVSVPLQIGPMATTGFVVDSADQRGGWGANFLVDWIAEDAVYEPIVEAIMVSTQGTEGISFISQGRIVSQTP